MDKDNYEFGKFMVMDSLMYIAYAVGVYTTSIGAYWLFIG